MFNINNNLYRRAILILIAFLGSSFFLDSFLGHHSNNVFAQTLPFLIGYWLSLFPILILSTILFWILYWVHQKSNLTFSLFYIYCFLFIAPFLITGYGIWQSLSLEIKNVDIPVKNLPDYWKDKSIVHITDLHLRHVNQKDFLEQVVKEIISISPELVVITGDLIDSNSDDMRDLLSVFNKISSPILFTTGNHDRDFKELKNNHISLLDDKLFEKEGLQIIGLGYPRRSDNKNPAEVLTNRIVFDKNKPTILLYHTPTTIEVDKQGDRYISPNTEFAFVKNASIDLQLSGHTHGGQLFPFSVITHFIYKGYEEGLHQEGGFSLFVSTGLGTWGPPVRIFVPPEIAVIRLVELS